MGILVCSGCYNKNHRLGGLQTTETYFSQFWGLQVQDQGASMSGEGPLPGCRFLVVSSHGYSSQGAASSLSIFYKGTNPIYEGSTLMTCATPKGFISKYHDVSGLGFQHMNFGGTQTFRPQQ